MNSTNTQIDFLSFSPLNKSLQSLHYIALKHIRPLLLLLVLATGPSLTAQTKTYYVDAAKEDNSGEGTSWATAKKDLQVALDLAVAGDEIRVASGTYYPTAAPNDSTTDDRDKAFHLDKNVVLKGSYDTASNTQDYNNPSILSGDFLGDDVITGSGSTLSITNNTENAYHVLITVNLTAETIIDGFTLSGGNADGTADELTYSSNLFFTDSGGGMYNISSSPTITNSSFSKNTADYGGGMYNISSSPTIINSTFVGNSAAYGGGMNITGSSYPRLYNTVFYANTATDAAGLHDIDGIVSIHSNSSHNASDGTGRSINVGTGFVDLSEVADPFIDSTDPDGADGILGTADDGLVPSGTSPLIDAGDDAKNDEVTDITGGARVMDSAIDIGAYEGQSSLSSDGLVVETITLYPNPTSSAVNLSHTTATNTNYSLYDISGKRLATYEQSGTAHQLDVSSVSKGTYILKAISGLQVNYYRIVKE